MNPQCFCFSILFCLMLPVKAQEANRKSMFGEYSWSTGSPGKTVYKGDSSYVSISPVIYTTTTLHLKRFGRMVEITKAYHGLGMDSKDRGIWKLEKDTLSIRMGASVTQYLVIADTTGVSLKSLTSNIILFMSRKE